MGVESSGPKSPNLDDSSTENSKITDKFRTKKTENRALELWQKLFSSDTEGQRIEDDKETEDDFEEEKSPILKVWKSLGKIMRLGIAQDENTDKLPTEFIQGTEKEKIKTSEVSNEDNFGHNILEQDQIKEEITSIDDEYNNLTQFTEPKLRSEQNINHSEVQGKHDDLIHDDDTESVETNSNQSELKLINENIENIKQNLNIGRHDYIKTEINDKPTEKVIERGMSGALPTVLIGFEYLGRKRADKKQEIKIRNSQQQIEKLKDEEVKAKTEISKLRNKQQISEDDIYNLKYKTRSSDLKNDQSIDSGVGLGRTLTISKENQDQDLKKELIIENNQVAVAELKPIKPENSFNSPENIAKAVFQAAERGEAIEKQYELRQEIKDDVTLLSNNTNPLFNNSNVFTLNNVKANAQDKIRKNVTSTNMPRDFNHYNQAARNGFLGALVIVVFAILVFLFYRTIT